jgi:hypothetical protein
MVGHAKTAHERRISRRTAGGGVSTGNLLHEENWVPSHDRNRWKSCDRQSPRPDYEARIGGAATNGEDREPAEKAPRAGLDGFTGTLPLPGHDSRA